MSASVGLKAAPLSRRIAARLIDSWFLAFSLAGFWAIGFRVATSGCNGVDRCYGWAAFGIGILVLGLGFVASVLYESLMLALWGATLGKFALGLRVTRTDGSAAGPRRCLIRAVAFWLSVPLSAAAAFVFVGILTRGLVPGGAPATLAAAVSLGAAGLTIALLAAGKSSIHDSLAGTAVVRMSERAADGQAQKRRPSSRSMLTAAATVAITAVGAGLVAWAVTSAYPHELTSSERQSYIDDNQGLLDSLPQIPGSRQTRLQSLPYCRNGTIVGYSTWADYDTPTEMTQQQIADFYVSNLGDAWDHSITVDTLPVPPGPGQPSGGTDTATTALFRRGSAKVAVSIVPPPVNGVTSPRAYEVTVDSHRTDVSCHED